MPPAAHDDDWARLGRLLAERRIQLAPRYRNKALFAEERDINRRMLWAFETGKQGNYQPDTIRSVEASYELRPGAVGRILAGGDLESEIPGRSRPEPGAEEALDAAGDPGTPERVLFPGDDPLSEALRAAWRLPYPEEERVKVVAAIRALWDLPDPEEERREMIAAVLAKARGRSGSGARSVQTA